MWVVSCPVLDFVEERSHGVSVRDVEFADGLGGTAEAYACCLPACVGEGFEDLSAQQACCACDEGAGHDGGEGEY